MAKRLKIEGNFLVIFEDGYRDLEYLNEQCASLTPRYSTSNFVRFLKNGSQVGVGKAEFDCTTVIDDRTGIAFTSVDELKTLLSSSLGSVGSSGGSSYGYFP